MSQVYAVAGVLAIAMITPGPNNFAVLQTAARYGLRDTIPSIAGVVIGGLAMALVSLLGIGAWIAETPQVGTWLAAIGSVYLLWLASRLIVPRPSNKSKNVGAITGDVPKGAFALFAFQFMNPKAWVLVLTITSVVQSTELTMRELSLIAGAFVVIPTICLFVWSLCGAAVFRIFNTRSSSRSVDRIMGSLLALSVLFLWR